MYCFMELKIPGSRFRHRRIQLTWCSRLGFSPVSQLYFPLAWLVSWVGPLLLESGPNFSLDGGSRQLQVYVLPNLCSEKKKKILSSKPLWKKKSPESDSNLSKMVHMPILNPSWFQNALIGSSLGLGTTLKQGMVCAPSEPYGRSHGWEEFVLQREFRAMLLREE